MESKSGINKRQIMIIVFIIISLIHASLSVTAFAEGVSESGAEAGNGSRLSEAFKENTAASHPVTFADEKQLGKIRQNTF